MNSLPLHPAIVHLPMGLAILMPLLASGFAWAVWTGRAGRRAWVAVAGLQALLLASALVAINTGGAEEERVESVVSEAAIETHEETAEVFAWAAAASLALAILPFAVRSTSALRWLTASTVVATVVVAALGVRVGHAGGQLVYVHGAGAAYTNAAIPGGSRSEAPGERRPRSGKQHEK